jgi:hypothetical protein
MILNVYKVHIHHRYLYIKVLNYHNNKNKIIIKEYHQLLVNIHSNKYNIKIIIVQWVHIIKAIIRTQNTNINNVWIITMDIWITKCMII